MAETFDAYHKWLGIPPEEQPPHHYRLLSIQLWESDGDVIENAADKAMAHVRTFQTGLHGSLSQRLLNALASAKVCLLNPAKKAAYDEQLRQQLASSVPAAQSMPGMTDGQAVSAELFQPSVSDGLIRAPIPTAPSGKKGLDPRMVYLGGAVGAVLVAAIVVFAISSGGKPPPERQTAAVKSPTDKKSARADSLESGLPSLAPIASAERPAEKEQPSPVPSPQPPKESSEAKSEPGLKTPPRKPTEDQPVVVVEPPAAARSREPARESERHAVPSAEVQRELGAKIDEVYRVAEAKQPEAKVKAAKDLLEAAKTATSKPDEQFVLLRKSAELAFDAGDAALMLEALDLVGDGFVIDLLAAKTGMLERFAKAPRNPVRFQSLLEGSARVIDEALQLDRYEVALKVASLLVDACPRNNPPLRKETAERRKRVVQLQRQFQDVQKALDALKTDPADADANSVAGSWYCLVRGDWETGLRHLAKGSDESLKALAQRELSQPTEAADRVKLADAWWDAAESRRGSERDSLLLHAGEFYRDAIDTLEGLEKVRVQKRLAEIGKIAPPRIRAVGQKLPLAVAPFDAKRARWCQTTCARALKASVEQINSIGMRLVLIPPGEFTMGSSDAEVKELLRQGAPGWYTERLPEERPQHRVRISKPFYMAAYEVTQAEYRRVMGDNPSYFSKTGGGSNKVVGQDTERFPADQVSWHKAQEFCHKLSAMPEEKQAGRTYRLPTEAEWEYACRAGTQTRYSWGDDDWGFGDYAWFWGNSGETSHPVGQKRPNAFGVFDMHGNVWEWCEDCPSADQFQGSLTMDPMGPATSPRRTYRGGGRAFGPDARSAFRHPTTPITAFPDTGFRVVCVPEALASMAAPDRRRGTSALPVPKNIQPIFIEEFDQPKVWKESPGFERGYANGVYYFDGPKVPEGARWAWPVAPYGDCVVEVTGRVARGYGGAFLVDLFNRQRKQGIDLFVFGDGRVVLSPSVFSEGPPALPEQAWPADGAVRPAGQYNTLRLVVKQDTLEIRVNSRRKGSLQLPFSLSPGDVGLGLYGGGKTRVEFERLMIWPTTNVADLPPE